MVVALETVNEIVKFNHSNDGKLFSMQYVPIRYCLFFDILQNNIEIGMSLAVSLRVRHNTSYSFLLC